MTLFQLILLAATAFFAYQVYKHTKGLQDHERKLPSEPDEPAQTPTRQKAAEPMPGDVDALIRKADDAYAHDALSDARVYLERAEKQDPDNPALLGKLGFILDRLGESQEALAKYTRLLRMDPNDDLTHNAMAEILRKLGRLDEAQEHLKSAADIDDGFELTYYHYGLLLIDKQDFDGAKMMFEKALELKPDYAEAREALERL